MEERIRMLSDYDTGNWSVSELCRRYGVSRDTFYEWRRRRELGAADWFMDRSHAPTHCPHATAGDVKEEVVIITKDAQGFFALTAVSASWAVQVAGAAQAPHSRDVLACCLDHWRDTQASRAD